MACVTPVACGYRATSPSMRRSRSRTIGHILSRDAPVPEAALRVLAVELAVVALAGVSLPTGPDLLAHTLVPCDDADGRRCDAIGEEGRRHARSAVREDGLVERFDLGEE